MKNFSLSCPLKGITYSWTKETNKEIIINQYFGENLCDFYAKLGLKGHNGIDFGVRHIETPNHNGGTPKSVAFAPIYAPCDGTITSDEKIQSDTKGRFIDITTDPVLLNGKECKVKITLFHLADVETKLGQKVKQGMVVGYGGNTGEYTTGAHLHFGIYPMWKNSNGVYAKDTNNGYAGAIDPLPYFTDCRHVMSGEKRYWQKGKEIIKEQRALILNS